MIELVKKLTNQTDDEAIQFYMTNAINAIKTYTNDPNIDVKTTYHNEVVELACYYINKATMSQTSTENGNVKSLSSGGRSVTFMSYDELQAIGIPQSILARLPKPKSTVKVW